MVRRKKNKKGGFIFAIVAIIIAGYLFSQQFALIGFDDNRLSVEAKKTYNIGGNTIYINKIDFIGGCEQGLGTSDDDEWERTPDNGRHIWHKYIPIKFNGVQYIYETNIWGSQTKETGCYSIPPISTSSVPASNWLSGYHVEKNNNGVLFEANNIQVSMGMSRASVGGTISSLSTVRSKYCPYYFGGNWNSDLKTCEGAWSLLIDVKDKKLPYTIEAPTTLFTNQNFNVPVKFDSFWQGRGFVEVKYSYEGSIFQDVIQIHNFTFKKGMNTFNVPVPTQTEAKLKATYRIGIYMDLDNEYKTYVTEPQTISILINPKPLWLEKTTCGNNCEGCPGYTLSNNNEYCVNFEVQDISCMQIGCPVLEGHNYQCMSSGYCSEFVNVYIDRKINESQCNEICDPLGGVCQLSENQDWYCVEKKIVEVIKELPTPVYISKTCEDFDICDESVGYKCVDIDINGTIQATCEKTVVKIDEDVYTIAIIILIIAIIASGVIIFRRRKRRR